MSARRGRTIAGALGALGAVLIALGVLNRDAILERYWRARLDARPSLLVELVDADPESAKGRAVASFVATERGGAALVDAFVARCATIFVALAIEDASIASVSVSDDLARIETGPGSVLHGQRRVEFGGQVLTPVPESLRGLCRWLPLVAGRGFILDRYPRTLIRVFRQSEMPVGMPRGRVAGDGTQVLAIGERVLEAFPYLRINARSKDTAIAEENTRRIVLLDELVAERRRLLDARVAR